MKVMNIVVTIVALYIITISSSAFAWGNNTPDYFSDKNLKQAVVNDVFDLTEARSDWSKTQEVKDVKIVQKLRISGAEFRDLYDDLTFYRREVPRWFRDVEQWIKRDYDMMVVEYDAIFVTNEGEHRVVGISFFVKNSRSKNIYSIPAEFHAWKDMNANAEKVNFNEQLESYDKYLFQFLKDNM